LDALDFSRYVRKYTDCVIILPWDVS